MVKLTNHGQVALINPDPYEGQVRRGISPKADTYTVIEAATNFDLPPLIKRIGDWVITREGIHCLVSQYDIPKDQIMDPTKDWVKHVTEKNWVDHGDFSSIFYLAKEMIELEMI